jgi:hypothetical protein
MLSHILKSQLEKNRKNQKAFVYVINMYHAKFPKVATACLNCGCYCLKQKVKRKTLWHHIPEDRILQAGWLFNDGISIEIVECEMTG